MPSRRHLATLVLFGTALTGCKRGPQLHYVATGQNGEKFYVDATTVHASGDERSFTLVAVEARPKISLGQAYDRTTTNDRVTCGSETFVLGGLRGYSGDSVVFDNPGENPITMQPGGPFEAAYRYVCGR